MCFFGSQCRSNSMLWINKYIIVLVTWSCHDRCCCCCWFEPKSCRPKPVSRGGSFSRASLTYLSINQSVTNWESATEIASCQVTGFLPFSLSNPRGYPWYLLYHTLNIITKLQWDSGPWRVKTVCTQLTYSKAGSHSFSQWVSYSQIMCSC